YLIRLRQLLRWLGISEADMERGQLRCDANVSIRPKGSDELNPKTEIKNVNSIENVRDAIEAEIARQIREVEAGHTIQAWTLDWDEDSGTLRKMRQKETEADYRYFREPDLLPVRLKAETLEQIRADMPELPLARKVRFVEQYAIPDYDAEILTEERSLADYFEHAVKAYDGAAKSISNWLMNDVLRMLRERNLTAGEFEVKPDDLATIVAMVESNQVTTNTAKELLEKVVATGESPTKIVEAEGLAQVSDDSAIRQLAQEVLDQNPEQVATYKSGKETLIGWFVGQVMKASKGKANPQMAKQILEDLLDS
ncbi:MAG: Asp-tRNA(Asn)/Glu-tRNA(Gln) amidotransferase subunit GatB, partial [Anaerolineales bacterium]